MKACQSESAGSVRDRAFIALLALLELRGYVSNDRFVQSLVGRSLWTIR
jgi:hypothetical protein